MNTLELPFDIYQRYKIIQDVIEILRPDPSRRFRILDAGGGTGPITGFLPNDRVFMVDQTDCNLPNFQKADVLALPFKNKAFDIVLSTDVLEHIPPAQRGQFLNELWRVCRRYVLLAAPFYSSAAARSEKILFEFIKTKLGYEHRFLKEHLDNGLPNCAEMRGYMERLGADTVTLPNGFLSHWLPMMLVTYYFDADPESVPLSRLISAFYNESYYASDNCEPAYRSLIVAAKRPLPEAIKARLCRLISQEPKAMDFSAVLPLMQCFQLEYAREKERQLKARAAQLANLHIPAVNPDIIQRARRNTLEPISAELSDHPVHLASLESLIREKDRMIEAILNEKKRHTEAVVLEKSRHMEEVVKEKEQQIEEIARARDRQVSLLVRERDETIVALTSQTESLERQLSHNAAHLVNLEGTLQEKERMIEALLVDKERFAEALFREKGRHIDEVVTEKERQIQEIAKARDAQIAMLVRDRDQALANLTNRVASLEQELSQNATYLARLDGVLREKDLLIESMLKEKEQFAEAVVEEKTRHINEVVQEKERQIQEIVQEKERQIEEIVREKEQQVLLLDQELSRQAEYVTRLDEALRAKDLVIEAVLKEKEKIIEAVLWEKARHVEEVVQGKEHQIEEIVQGKERQIEAIVQARDAQFALLVRERDEALATLAGRIALLEQELSQQAAQVAPLNDALREKDGVIAALQIEKEQITRAVLQEKDRHIAEVVQEKEQQIQEIVAEKERQIDGLIKARDLQIDLLCKDRDETMAALIHERNALLEAKSAEIDLVKNELLQKEEAIRDLDARLAAMRAELDIRDKQINRLQEFVDKIKRTWPYRLFRRLNSPT